MFPRVLDTLLHTEVCKYIPKKQNLYYEEEIKISDLVLNSINKKNVNLGRKSQICRSLDSDSLPSSL